MTESGDLGNFIYQKKPNSTDGVASLGVIPTSPAPASTTTFVFDGPINAFGFDIANESLSNFFVNVSGDVTSSIFISAPNTFAFWGAVDTMGTFDTLNFSPSGNTGVLMMDSVAFASVPEPSSFVLFALGGTALVCRRRKRVIQTV